MPKPILIQGKDQWVNLAIIRGDTAGGDVNLVLELYDEEPSWVNGVASVEPAKTIHAFGDAASLYDQFAEALKVLDLTRSH